MKVGIVEAIGNSQKRGERNEMIRWIILVSSQPEGETGSMLLKRGCLEFETPSYIFQIID
jgi:hypothetical protein